MVVRKAAQMAKKKNIQELKKKDEKKIIMKEESEDEDITEKEDDSNDEQNSGSEDSSGDNDGFLVLDDDDEKDDDDDDDDEDDDEEEDEEDDEDDDDDDDEEEDVTNLKSKNKNTKQTPVKGMSPNKTPAKTPNKMVAQQNSQRKQLESKTPIQKKALNQEKHVMSISPKKTNEKLSPSKQIDSNPLKRKKTEEDDEEDDDDDDDDDDDENEDDDDDDDDEEEEDDKDDSEDETNEPKAKKMRTEPMKDLKVEEKHRLTERDACSLFVRNIGTSTTAEELKALSPDILEVRIPFRRNKSKGFGSFAFLLFASEKKAEENYSILQSKKFKGTELFVDYVGEKSQNKTHQNKRSEKNVNKTKLFVSNIPNDATMEDLGKAFPLAMNLYVKTSGSSRIAHVSFENEKHAEEAFNKGKDLLIKGYKTVVLYAIVSNKRRPGRQRERGGRGQGNRGGFRNRMN